MFFWKKKRSEDADTVEEVLTEMADAPKDAIEKVEEATKASMQAGEDAGEASDAQAADQDTDGVKLFPGFEGKPFQVGYAQWSEEAHSIAAGTSVLVMRWSEEENWFPIPAAFNKAFMQVITEADQDDSLSGLLKAHGYDINPEKRA